MHEFKAVRLHLFHPSRLAMRQVWQRYLEQRLEWGMIDTKDKVPITQLKLPSLCYCHDDSQPLPVRSMVPGLWRQELSTPIRHGFPLGVIIIKLF